MTAAACQPSWEDLRNRRLALRRAAAREALLRAEALVREAGGRLLVFGSLVEGGFHDRSDIDAAVLDLPAGQDADLAVQVDTLLSLAGFEADIHPERFLPPTLRDRVLRHGREPHALG